MWRKRAGHPRNGLRYRIISYSAAAALPGSGDRAPNKQLLQDDGTAAIVIHSAVAVLRGSKYNLAAGNLTRTG